MVYKGSNYTVKILTLMLKNCAGSHNGGDGEDLIFQWLSCSLAHFDFIGSM